MLSLFLISILHSSSIDFRYDEVWAEIRRQQVKYFVIKFLTEKISNKILQSCVRIFYRFTTSYLSLSAGSFLIWSLLLLDDLSSLECLFSLSFRSSLLCLSLLSLSLERPLFFSDSNGRFFNFFSGLLASMLCLLLK